MKGQSCQHVSNSNSGVSAHGGGDMMVGYSSYILFLVLGLSAGFVLTGSIGGLGVPRRHNHLELARCSGGGVGVRGGAANPIRGAGPIFGSQSIESSSNVRQDSQQVPSLPDRPQMARHVAEAYASKFASEAESVVRAPGRVNLVGEHVDYSLYGVMPMALELAVYMAVGRGDGTENGITLCNTDSERFPMRMLSADPSQEIGQGGAHDWSGYFLCGYRGVFDVARRDRLLPESVLTKGLPGLRVMVSGQVPPGGGLSSSAAMVVASALATAEALGLRLTKVQLASLCIEAERYIGVLSGGMDQSCSVMGLDGHALHIEFTPSLRADPVALPPGCAFVVSNCLSKAEKAVQPLLRYNKRVVECKLAAKLLGKQLRLDNWQLFETLWEVQEGVHARGEPSSLRDMASLAHELLPHGACSQKQLTSHLGTEPMHVLPKARVMADVLGASDDFWLHDRAVHVYEEAARVHEFKAVCSDPVLSDEGKVEALGKLMNDSHFSCSKMFDCSCPELEELVALSRQAGAVGSRLTGAGWGGCSVSLVKEDRVEEFLDAVKHKFYGDKYREGAMFVSRPAAGACVYPTP